MTRSDQRRDTLPAENKKVKREGGYFTVFAMAPWLARTSRWAGLK